MKRLNFSDARHLVVRTGIGEEWADIKRWEGRNLDEVVNHLLNVPTQYFAPPKVVAWTSMGAGMNASQGNMRESIRKRLNQDKFTLKEWWLNIMLRTKTPLAERMTLFWHNHFTSSINKVNQPRAMLQQNHLFRKHALGNFRTLLHAVVKDPAMLIYLDGHVNVKGKPNENFARELMELFTVGRSPNQKDVIAVSRAFTGDTVDRKSNKFVHRSEDHDGGMIYFRGKKGRFRSADIVDILLEDPLVAQHIATKVWRAFVSDSTPEPREIHNWAKDFRESDYDIKTLMSAMLKSDAFWSRQNRGAMIKSPIDLVIGTLRAYGIRTPGARRLAQIHAQFGLDLFSPPNVKGWAGGTAWLDSYTLPTRKSLIFRLSGGVPHERGIDQAKMPKLDYAELEQWILSGRPISSDAKQASGQKKQMIALMSDAVYQLK